MTDVAVAILHAEAPRDAGPLTRAVADARLGLADRHAAGFRAAGATAVWVVAGPPDDVSFGARLRALVRDLPSDGRGGLVVLASGAVSLATPADRRAFIEAAAAAEPAALTNNRYSADILAVSLARSALADVPDLPADNGLPRWLAEVAGVAR